MSQQTEIHAEKEKRSAALSSVLAAIFLTSFKIAVGLATNSLGILSEAAHSALDLVAAGVTYFAVRVSDHPPDSKHPYGHGKVENLSALIETVLLLATCGFILYEATLRLFFRSEEVEVSIYSFLVMGVSIVVDLTRSRLLKKMADKHQSQALEADALHFSTDVWSSAVVILGLGALALADYLEPGSRLGDILRRADAVAAVAVAVIVVWVSVRLGRKAVDVLLDGGMQEEDAHLREVLAQVPGVIEVLGLRLRPSGADSFVDTVLGVSRELSFAQAHEVAVAAELAVKDFLPRADVVVHVEPLTGGGLNLVETLRARAREFGLSVHGTHVLNVGRGAHVELHVEAPDNLSLKQAHALVTRFEKAVRCDYAGLESLVTHIEPRGGRELSLAGPEDLRKVSQVILRLPEMVPEIEDCHKIVVHRSSKSLSVSFHCRMDPLTPLPKAHETSSRIERLLLSQLPELGRVVVHIEPGRPQA